MQPPEITQGSFTAGVRVPNELPDANTTAAGADARRFSVRIGEHQAQDGLTATTTEANLATPTTNDDGETVSTYVSEISWTGEIKPGEFDESRSPSASCPRMRPS